MANKDVIMPALCAFGQDIGGNSAQAAFDAVAFYGGFIDAFGDRKANAFEAIIIRRGLDDQAVRDPFAARALNFQEISAFFDRR